MKCLLPLAAGLCFALFACNQSPSEKYENKQAAVDSNGEYRNGSSSAAVENNKDTLHRFIRTADLKFKVTDVAKTTYKIEDIVTRHGGFVTLTQLNSQKEDETTTPVSEDSAVETTRFMVTNTMTVRVPNTRLDTTLKDIAQLVGYLDYRIIKADDISLQLRSNSLQQKRSTQHVVRLTNAIDKQGKKLSETTAAEEALKSGAANADEALLSNLSLADQISFSTVQLSIYQRQSVSTEVVPTYKEVAAYEPHFGRKLLNALQNGFSLLGDIFIGVVQIWPLLLLAVVGIGMYRKYKTSRSAFLAHRKE